MSRMSRLEDMAIAKMRDRMSKASIVELAGIKNEIKLNCKGGNEHVVFDEALMRDLYAYAVINFLNMYGFSVFGGFVAAHISGKPWNDIDVMMPSDAAIELDHIFKVVMFLRFAFSFKATELFMTESANKKYAKEFTLCITDENVKHKIKIDVAPRWCNDRMLWLPVSIGKCLMMRDNIIFIRDIRMASSFLFSWKVDDVLELLRSGRDVSLSLARNHHSISYSMYFWTRIKAMRTAGYVVDTFLGDTPSQLSHSLQAS